ncbi:hypothetical protein N802_12530 [Knoellia sinensis KCTC 19936]|uniref:DUF2690 domain-containing protein n=2 Tax=Knoellia TaxID=136099 RepID=A0A0A0JAE4_9MICO|nr:hypothetical protein N802_12530 [Knoellia sinensis KCTC 19936]
MLATAAVAASTIIGFAAPAQAADLPNQNIRGQWCTNITQIGAKDTASAAGVTALTVRQYKAVCNGSWKNFANIFVWEQFHAKGFAYNASAGVLVADSTSASGWREGVNRDREVFSEPVSSIAYCTRGMGKIRFHQGGTWKESGLGLSSRVC